jgi:predicted SAM-dependent methyltransferase
MPIKVIEPIRNDLKYKLSRSIIKLHLGCGNTILNDYINIDLYNPKADLKEDIIALSQFDKCTVDEIFMNAVFEHLFLFQQSIALNKWYNILKVGGKLIINSIPDFDECIKAYQNKATGHISPVFDLFEVYRYTHGDPHQHDAIGQIHKALFTKESVYKAVELAGFKNIIITNTKYQTEEHPVNINVTAIKE